MHHLSTHLWYLFWLGNFIFAGSAFLVITLIVMVRGIADLRAMFSRLRRRDAESG